MNDSRHESGQLSPPGSRSPRMPRNWCDSHQVLGEIALPPTIRISHEAPAWQDTVPETYWPRTEREFDGMVTGILLALALAIVGGIWVWQWPLS